MFCTAGVAKVIYLAVLISQIKFRRVIIIIIIIMSFTANIDNET